MSSAKNGISAREVERLIGVTPETAWFMLHRLREAMKREPLAGLLSGVVVSDETWIGGDPKNRHGHKPGGTKGQTSKTPVVALVDTRTGEVRSTVVPRVNGDNLRRVIERNVDMDATVLHTDSALAYKHIGPTMAGHEKVDHYSGEYVNRNGATTNHAEGYFSQLKRSIDGTHHHVSVEHLPRYLAQFDFLYSTRRLDDSVRLQRMVDQAEGRRLTYRPLLQGE
jgi:transposase-like protein